MLRKNWPIILSIVLLWVVAGLNILAFQSFWYWKIWWFDLMMHGLGGLALGLLANDVSRRLDGDNFKTNLVSMISISLALVAVISVGWEFFEFTIDRSVRLHVGLKSLLTLQQGAWDTLTDIAAALSGSLVGGVIFYLNYHYYNLWLKPKIELE